MAEDNELRIRLGLPKGRMQQEVSKLLADAGIQLHAGTRTYRPLVSLPEFEAKILKPQDIVAMLHLGSRDLGFAGADWVPELNAQVVELLDTGLDPVRLVAAAPESLLQNGRLPQRPLIVASEYEQLTKQWIKRNGLNATFVHAHGATEVFPPEDADCIVDNTASGATLRANNLTIVDVLMASSTRLYANPKVLERTAKREVIERFVMLLRSVIQARKRVMVEMNVSADDLERLCSALPCMREPTIAPLHGNAGYAVKVAIPRAELPRLIPEIKAHGGTDIVVTTFSQIVP